VLGVRVIMSQILCEQAMGAKRDTDAVKVRFGPFKHAVPKAEL
jgi:hypothetical protein